MAYQNKALNGDTIDSRLVPDNILRVLGLSIVPQGLIGIDLDTGLAIVVPAADKKPIKMRIGKLLKRLKHTDIEQTTVGANARKLALAMKAELKLTSSGDEVIEVYANGPRSCMKGEDAVRVYDTEDVAVAYIEVDNTIIARAVVCKNEEIGLRYGSIYGVEDPLKYLLDKQGYEHHRSPLDGCRLVRISDLDGTFVMPYIDGNSKVADHGDYMVVDDWGDYGCNSQSGYTEHHTCDDCGETVISEEDLYYSEHLQEQLCESCFDDCHVRVDDEVYHKESDSIQQLEDGDYVLIDDAAYVEYRDEWHNIDDCYYNSYTEEYVLKEDVQ